jgi:hypothetical protein
MIELVDFCSGNIYELQLHTLENVPSALRWESLR